MTKILIALVVVLVGALVWLPSWPLAFALAVVAVVLVTDRIVEFLAVREKGVDDAMRKRVDELESEMSQLRRLAYAAKPGR